METHSRHPPSSAASFNLNHQHNQQQQQQQNLINFHDPMQHMFEKPLTPSDVGKLNRLVIPKQHAETYFPLINQQQGSMLVSFEDEYRKLWRFRYSYWNSSQSYVFTKGWSRYVKEKRLDAGDIVLFQRHMLDCNKMFIGWRRRAQPLAGGGDQSTYPLQHVPLALPLPYQLDDHAGDIYENLDAYQRGVVATRRLRLFGVNLECPADSEPSTTHGSSQGDDHQYNFNSDSSYHNMVLSDEFQVTIKLAPSYLGDAYKEYHAFSLFFGNVARTCTYLWGL